MNSKFKPQKRLLLDFYPSEAALIEQVEKQPKKQTYIKDLIRKDLAAESDPFVEAIMAVRKLGVSGYISLNPLCAPDRIYIRVNCAYFGIWDTVRKTFVD